MRKLTMSLFLLLFLLSSFSLADVPTQINYQGVLKDSAGLVNNPGLQMTFSIYNVDTGGAPLWDETQLVTVEGGLYSVQLGSQTNPITPEVFSGVPRYLGVMVVGEPEEMKPRILIVSVPYAFRAEQADNVSSSISINTTGSITAAAFSGNGSGLTNISGTATGGNADTLGGLSPEAFVRLGPSTTQETDAQYGINVRTNNTNAKAVGIYGETTSIYGTNYGVHGKSSASGAGVYGESRNKIGVKGEATGTENINWGVYGKTSSPDGFAGYFLGGNGIYADGIATKRTKIDSTNTQNFQYTLKNNDSVVFVDASDGIFEIYLPKASPFTTFGRVYYIYKIDASAYPVRVRPDQPSGDTINDTTYWVSTDTRWRCVRVVGLDDSEWVASVF